MSQLYEVTLEFNMLLSEVLLWACVCLCVRVCVLVEGMKDVWCCVTSSCSNRMGKHKVCVRTLLNVHVAGCCSGLDVTGAFSGCSGSRNILFLEGMCLLIYFLFGLIIKGVPT